MTPAYPQRIDHAAELKRRLTDAGRLCQALGLLEGYKPERQARGGLVIRCPVHGDRTPSCSVRLGDDGTLSVRCHGCPFVGNALHLIAAARHLDIRQDFRAVLQEAADLAGYTLDGRPPAPIRALPPPTAPAPPAPARIAGPAFVATAEAVLELCPLAGSIAVGLASRGILEEARRDGWGELPRNTMLPGDEGARALAGGFDADDPAADELVATLLGRLDAVALSWLVRGRELAHPDHRLLIPWRDPAAALWGLQRRYAPRFGDETPEKGRPKYLWPSRDDYAPSVVHAYGADAPELAAAEEVWIVEGAVDVLALRALNRAGLLSTTGQPRSMAVLGLPGVQAWSAYRASVLGWVPGRIVRVALDGDRAGRAAVAAIGEEAWTAGARDVRDKAPPPGAKDWGELAAKRLGTERRV